MWNICHANSTESHCGSDGKGKMVRFVNKYIKMYL